jgi:hypothetical protein
MAETGLHRVYYCWIFSPAWLLVALHSRLQWCVRYIRQLREPRSCELVAMDMGRLWKSEATEDVPCSRPPIFNF